MQFQKPGSYAIKWQSVQSEKILQEIGINITIFFGILSDVDWKN